VEKGGYGVHRAGHNPGVKTEKSRLTKEQGGGGWWRCDFLWCSFGVCYALSAGVGGDGVGPLAEQAAGRTRGTKISSRSSRTRQVGAQKVEG